MTKELKEKWVTALRSGEYKQGLKTLRDGDTYCCLGVLADICECEWKEPEYDNVLAAIFENDLRSSYWAIRQEYADKIGLSTQEQQTLADMNDIHKNSFSEIADYIEDNL